MTVRARRALRAAATLAGSVALVVVPAAVHAIEYEGPPEDYASYQPQTGCREAVRPGTAELAEWLNARFDGGQAVASLRPCGSGSTSEHKDGRAIDWSMDAGSRSDRRVVAELLDKLFAHDIDDNQHALARRMGVMYVIWDDRVYASYNAFAERVYRSSSCASLRRCSTTLRHRDHVHISLSRPGGRGVTSWYDAHD